MILKYSTSENLRQREKERNKWASDCPKNNMQIVKLEKKHLDKIAALEKECFAIPWSKKSFEDELKNKLAIYFAAVDNDEVIGYMGMWHVVNEGHITNVAVSPKHRKKHIASTLLETAIAEAKKLNMLGLTLEVRKSNTPALSLYKKFGFKPEGIRKEYYEDNREDAIIMWKYLIPEEQISTAGK
jgi:ribosomal-protein-alanine N-acetyltransferase